ncbi:DUF3995 domain-containing protein [Kitasatospora sp. NPDC049258]|uniref:DUF3995 domain-containing protein n=1 Tax=Kitasatospora sp. NPDC049258 TaxID=3155394 RepID=UPI003417F6FF
MRSVGAAVAAALGGIGVLHAVWMRSPWPLGSREQFAELVVGVAEERAPTPAMCAGVAGALGAAGYLVGARAGALPSAGPRRLAAVGSGTVAGVLLARGIGGPVLFGSGRIPRAERFVRLDRRCYAPLCVLLGAGAALVAVRGRGGAA